MRPTPPQQVPASRDLVSPAEARSAASFLQPVVDRIVQVAKPDRVILFGSAVSAPETARDLDFLVVKEGITSRRPVAQAIYKALIGIPVAVDVIVVTPEDIDLLKDGVATVIGPAVREGRVVYAA